MAGFCPISTAFVAPQPPTGVTVHRTLDTRKHFDIGSMIKNFGKKVTASHILIGPASSITGRGMEQADAQSKLLELKEEIGNDPAKFAAAAEEFSSCRASMKKGGDLGEFGPGMMVGPFDKICFEEEVGAVHGPVSTPFGEVSQRSSTRVFASHYSRTSPSQFLLFSALDLDSRKNWGELSFATWICLQR